MDNKKTILIIDDMKQIRDILWFSLKQEGYKPILAETGRQGIDLLFYSEEKIDLILLDVMMPEMDGFLVLKKIRSSFLEASTTPIIMLTAKAQKDDVIRGLQKGADDYVLKPYKFPDLLVKIKNLIG